ncbi:transcriptional regulator [Roseibium sp. MMSF_3544]|uniref:transcriptional regulator n=1 Tax=unclassified Roseibium TaxID=2629323 RepID=UPI00273F60DD|nr:transcriptional regulator [Roseibium sp. MMSF_3544]
MINIKSEDIFNITPAQLRAARSLVDWSAQTCADAAKVGVASIRRAERRDDGKLGLLPAVEAAIRNALEEAGVEFIPENGGGPGVRLKKEELNNKK